MTISAIVLLLCSVLRAVYVPITIDEARSILDFSSRSVWNIISFGEDCASANNHILNTLLIKLSNGVLGPGELAHRFPSLLSHAFFLFFSIRVAGRVKNMFPSLCLFFLINTQPYLFDFFSLARGYGLAMAFLMMAIYYLLCYAHKSSPRLATLCVVFSSMAMLSNFSSLVFLLAMCGALVCSFHIQHKELERREYRKALLANVRYPIIILLIMGIIVFEPVRKLKAFGDLYYGGEKGFWEDTVGSLANSLAYSATYQSIFVLTLKLFVGCTIILALVWFVINVFKSSRAIIRSNFVLVFFTLLLAVLITMVEFHLIHIKFLIGRTAMQFVLLFAVVFGFFLDDFTSAVKSAKWIVAPISLIAILACVGHFSSAFNLQTTNEWKFDSDSRNVIADIQNDVVASGTKNQRIALACSWPPIAGLNYYRIIHKQDWLLPIEEDTIRRRVDYYYLMKWLKPYNFDTLEIVKDYPNSGGVLVKPKNKSNK